MHRDIAHHLVFLALTYLLVSVSGPALLPADTRHAQSPPVPCHHDDRRTYCRACNRSPYRPAPAPLCQPQPCRGGSDLERPPGGGVTRRDRRGASARRRGCRGGQAWRRSGPGGRQRNLLMGLINIQSLLPKIAALQHDHLNRLQHDVCIITETWLRSATASRLVTFPGYALHHADRHGDAGYGGVAVLVRDSYAASVIPQPAADCVDCRLESLWLRVKPDSGPHFTIAAVYRPPRRTVGLKSMFPRPGSPTVGRSVTWLNPHRGLEGAPPPETWCSPRSSPATCPGSHTDRAIKRACGEGFWRAIFVSTCWPRFVVRLPAVS